MRVCVHQVREKEINKHSHCASRKMVMSETAVNQHSSPEVGSENLKELKNSQQEKITYMGPTPISQTKLKLNSCLDSEILVQVILLLVCYTRGGRKTGLVTKVITGTEHRMLK